tara:strand:- start:1244 stop:2137 length:894 start_codon:yes stop_codon:yes gene_type:complete
MEVGFIKYSNGKTVVPPVGELLFYNPPGDVHIKYGYIKDEKYYVIKIASGFYENHKLGIPSGQGLMLLFNQKTGELESVLLDQGHLTNVRTAAAGALAVKYFGPKKINGIGIIGSGVQARMQLEYINKINSCKNVWIWARDTENAMKLKLELDNNFDVKIASSTLELAQKTNLIITTTAAQKPLLKAKDINKGTLIVAVGSDTENKQELESKILNNADLIISDSIPQSKSRGEIFKAVSSGMISNDKVIELGNAIQDVNLQRTDKNQVIVVDLTGVAVQDIMIASSVYESFIEQNIN